ncbi:MAG: CAP domain-containing protein [Patescibacteria group bacterium]
MRKTVKKYFIPHVGNSFYPHFFRFFSVLLIIIILVGSQLLLRGAFKTLSKNDSYAAIFIGALLSYTNEARADSIGQTLATSPLLTKAAELKASDMAEKGYFSHNTPDGKTPWYWFKKVGYNYRYAGENLAVDFMDSKDVTDAWMASPGHRANILNSRYTEIGIATAVGNYQGRETTFVVQMFGTPAPKLPEYSNLPANVSAVDKIISSPKSSLVNLYSLLIVFVALLMLLAAIFEFRKHHKGIWLSGGLLILFAGALIALTLGSGKGIVFFWF